MSVNKLREAAKNQAQETKNLPVPSKEEPREESMVSTEGKRGRGRPKSSDPMVRKSYAIHKSTYEEIQRFVESKGDQMGNYVRRAIIEKYQSDRRKG